MVLEGKKPRKQVVKILEIGERSQDGTDIWRQMLGDTQEPWPIIPGRGVNSSIVGTGLTFMDRQQSS